MPEELITGTGLATALGAKLLYDVCGPTAKYLGGEFGCYAKIGVDNLKKVFTQAERHIKALGKSDGQVPPRVLKDVLSQGYFCEDNVQSSYLGGVLASAKSQVSRDDRAVAYLSLIESLSSYQLRTHFILYSSILRFDGPNLLAVRRWSMSHGITVLLRESDYQTAMDFTPGETPTIISQHSFIGLEKRGLSERGADAIPPGPKPEETPFRYFYPTTLGIDLFLWGVGRGEGGLDAYLPALLDELDVPIFVKPWEIQLGHVSYG